MLKVKILKIQEEEIIEGKLEKKMSASVQVFLNIPTLEVDPVCGISFSNAPLVKIAEEKITFAEMKKIMQIGQFKNWQEIKDYLEQKYTKYFQEVFKEGFRGVSS